MKLRAKYCDICHIFLQADGTEAVPPELLDSKASGWSLLFPGIRPNLFPMQSSHPLASIVAVLVFPFATMAALAEEPAPLNTLTEEEKGAGWELLFDGKSFAGLSHWPTKEPLSEKNSGGKWKIVDGVLSLTPGGGDLYTTEAFENYEFSVEWKTEGNSGIMIRVDPAQGGPVYKVAPEMQVEREAGDTVHSPGALFDIYPPAKDTPVNADGWNSVRILVENGKVTHWLNDVELYTYTIGSEEWNTRIAGSKWKNTKGYGLTEKGHIGFQDHGAAVAFRNLKIRVIGEEEGEEAGKKADAAKP